MKRKKGLGPTKEIISKETLKLIGTWTAVVILLFMFVYITRIS